MPHFLWSFLPEFGRWGRHRRVSEQDIHQEPTTSGARDPSPLGIDRCHFPPTVR
ncbi:hypothetical protein CGRA01v4_05067 [Colletotrichum graminicola]|nr:hypothetical protein CGRA01v4_05067 [Colletotrichum graminicola]